MKLREYSSATPLRLLPARPLPPYSYVSGKFPHPTRDPRGHSYGATEPHVSLHREEDWGDCEPYRWGIDLFNHGYYWEAHEAWEAVWHAAGRRGAIADFCKALIKFAAAGVKAREGRPHGVQRHAQRAKQLLQSVAAQIGNERKFFMGMSLITLTECADALSSKADAIVDRRNEPVVVVMPFVLSIGSADK